MIITNKYQLRHRIRPAMWALVCVIIILFRCFHLWVRSGLPWFTFIILRGGWVYSHLWHRWSTNRPAPFPAQGPALIICNHTCSADPAFLLAAVDRPLCFVVAREHFNVHWFAHAILKELRCIPVVRGGNDPTSLREALRRLAEGGLVVVFPEGGLSGVGRNRLRPGRPGTAYLALKARVPIYPIYIAGGPRTEQLLESWMRPSPRAVRLIFGQPIDLSAYWDRPRTRQLIEEVTELLMDKIAELNPDRRRRRGVS